MVRIRLYVTAWFDIHSLTFNSPTQMITLSLVYLVLMTLLLVYWMFKVSEAMPGPVTAIDYAYMGLICGSGLANAILTVAKLDPIYALISGFTKMLLAIIIYCFYKGIK